MLSCIRSKNANELKQVAEEAKLSKIQAENLCRLATLYGDFPATIKKARKIAINKTMEDALDQLEAIYKAMRAVGLAKKMRLDFSMINDIEYYNGIIFQGYLDGLPRNVLSGGQYDGMMAKMGKELEAIGFALYLSELRRLPGIPAECDAEALVLYDESADLGKLASAVRKLAKEGLRVRTERRAPAGLRFRTVYRFTEQGLLAETGPESGAAEIGHRPGAAESGAEPGAAEGAGTQNNKTRAAGAQGNKEVSEC